MAPLCAMMHVFFAIVFMHMSINGTRALIAIMMLSGLLWPVSAMIDQPLWGQDGTDGSDDLSPGSYLWWGTFVKWLIVNFCACVPVLVLKALKGPTRRQIHVCGCFVYFVLGANIVWTVGLIKHQVVDWLNHVTAVFLTVSLILHCWALRKHACKDLFVMKHGFVYGYGTPFPWLICYTVWNVLFVAEISIGMTLQDILFWALMIGYRAMDTQRIPIEMYFAFARPVQLGTYIAVSDWIGTFVPLLRNAGSLKHQQPLPVNANAYFLFIVLMNLGWSIVVTWWAGHRVIYGFDPNHLADVKFLREDGDE